MFQLRPLSGLLIVIGLLSGEPSLQAQSNLPTTSASGWPGRTGPAGNSHVPSEAARDLPVRWSEEDGTGIRWKVPIHGKGHSTPTVRDGRIWLTTAAEDGSTQSILCLDADSGDVLIDRVLFQNPDPEPLNNTINTYASPTCALSADGVYVHFGSYGTARLDPQSGATVWERRDIACRHFRGPGSSPVLYEDLLILTFDGIDRQFLTALDQATGETVWHTDRTTDYGDLDDNGEPFREGDLRKAYGTPTLVNVEGRTQILSVGSRAAFGYDALTGKELWTIRHDDYNASAPPAVYKDLALINTGSRGANLLAVRLASDTAGDVTESHIAWNREKGNSDLSAPVVVGDRVFMTTNNGIAVCLKASAGTEVWRDRIGGARTASPLVANDLIYFCDEDGETTVIRAADQFEIVARNRLEEGMRASPAAAYGRMYLRSFGHLYCIESD